MATMTLNDMKKNLPVTAPAAPPATAAGFSSVGSFELLQRAAKCLTSSDLLPERYRGDKNIPNAVIALDMANRLGAAPLMVCQNLYVVHGTPSWSAQFLVATFNQCGKFSALRYEFCGKPGSDDWGCRAWAVETSTGERLEGTWVTLALAKKEGWTGKAGSKWLTMPEQMLRYRAAAWFIRAYAPEIAMGLPMRDEVIDTYEVPEEDIQVIPAKPAPEPKKEEPKKAEKAGKKEGNPAGNPAGNPVPAPEPAPEVEQQEAQDDDGLTDAQRELADALRVAANGDQEEAEKILRAKSKDKYGLGDILGFNDTVCSYLVALLRQDQQLAAKAASK